MDTFFVVGYSFESKYSENIHRCECGSEDGDETHEDRVALAVIVSGIVGREGNEGPERKSQRVEDLASCIHPHVGIQQFGHLKKAFKLKSTP